MKTQFNDYNLNCTAIDKAQFSKRRYKGNERKKKAGGGDFGEVLQRAMRR